MSRLVFPDENNTEWIAWKKISKKSTGIEQSHFRWTSDRFSEYSTTLPSINISPLNISLKPLKETRKSCPRPINSDLVIQLPPFTGSIKSRNTINLFTRSKNLTRELPSSNLQFLSDSIPKANFLGFRNKYKDKLKKKNKRFTRYVQDGNQKLSGVIGVGLLNDNNTNLEEVQGNRLFKL